MAKFAKKLPKLLNFLSLGLGGLVRITDLGVKSKNSTPQKSESGKTVKLGFPAASKNSNKDNCNALFEQC